MSAFRRTRSPRVSSAALQRLLDDVAAPGHADELLGLATALTAFAQAPAPRKRHVKAALVALLTAKALAPVAAATAVGGIALAAATGTLPGTADPHATPRTPAGSPGAHASATPSPSLVGLCHAYSAGVKDAKGKALDNPAFSALVAAAGGLDKVHGYCATVLAAAPGGRLTDLPSQALGHPTGKPASHPTGKPIDVPPSHPGKPSDVPPSHPAGPPSPVPHGH